MQQPRSSDTLQFNWSKTPAGDRAFLLQLIPSVGLIHSIEAGEDYTMLEIGWDEDDDESDEESNEARSRVIRKYETAERQVIKSKQEETVDKQVAFDEALSTWKRDYYKVNLLQVSMHMTLKNENYVLCRRNWSLPLVTRKRSQRLSIAT